MLHCLCAAGYLWLSLIRVVRMLQGLADGLALLTRAFAADPSHSGVLTALSHFSLLREDFGRALALARAAFASAEGDAQRAGALTLMARAYHALGQLREAQQAYQQVRRKRWLPSMRCQAAAGVAGCTCPIARHLSFRRV